LEFAFHIIRHFYFERMCSSFIYTFNYKESYLTSLWWIAWVTMHHVTHAQWQSTHTLKILTLAIMVHNFIQNDDDNNNQLK
jgi:hypothetical protein